VKPALSQSRQWRRTVLAEGSEIVNPEALGDGEEQISEPWPRRNLNVLAHTETGRATC
jgi:hypothetical protein